VTGRDYRLQLCLRLTIPTCSGADAIDWPNEIGICERAADRCASNYHAWSHRQWILQSGPCLLQSELLRTEKFMRKHISDYSCYHYRQVLLGRAYELNFRL